MARTIAAIHLPEALSDGNSALVRLAGKIDSFSLVLSRTPECQLKRQIEKDYHAMVFATRKEVRKYCPKYRYFPGEGILDFSTDCASGQLGPGDLGKPPQPKRGWLCHQCCFFLGVPETQAHETKVSGIQSSNGPVRAFLQRAVMQDPPKGQSIASQAGISLHELPNVLAHCQKLRLVHPTDDVADDRCQYPG